MSVPPPSAGPAFPPQAHVAFLRFSGDHRPDIADLDADERRRLAGLATARGRRLFAAAHVFLRQTLSRLAPGIAPGEWRFEYSPLGRPALAAPFGGLALDFNLSHTDGGAAVAVVLPGDDGAGNGGGEAAESAAGEARIGVDVESAARPERDPARIERIARRFWSAPEAAAVADAPEIPARIDRFLTLWTLKESHAKATGQGLAGGMREPVFIPPAPERDGEAGICGGLGAENARCRIAPGIRADPAPSWHYITCRLGPRHWAAAAFHGTEPDWRVSVCDA